MWRGGLSLRRLSVLVHYLPPESAVVRTASDAPTGWDVPAYLLADLFHAFTGTPHPARPTQSGGSKAKRYAALRARLEAQRARLEAPSP